MPQVLHKFRNHFVNRNSKILILGTFNPDVPTGPDFFYGRPRNYLWQLLPACWNLESLKNKELRAKRAFMELYKIDFADLIQSVEVPEGTQTNVDDAYIDGFATQWNAVIPLIDSLESLNAVYFTRKTFVGIPNIKERVLAIENHCLKARIRFHCLETPARFANLAKQRQWKDVIVNNPSQ